MYGRSITESGHFYLQNRKGLYPGYPDLKIKKLVLTEAVIDAASLGQMENLLENYAVLSLYGTNGSNDRTPSGDFGMHPPGGNYFCHWMEMKLGEKRRKIIVAS